MTNNKMEFYCWDHEITFKNGKHLENHYDNECQQMLTEKNVCTFLLPNGECCRKSFRMTSTLMSHYQSEHSLFACTQCYQTFNNSNDLEAHRHVEGRNLRINPYKCSRCPTSWSTEKARRQHDTSAHRINYDDKETPLPHEFCRYCPKGFSHISSLHRHMRRKHGLEVVDANSLKNKKVSTSPIN